jgi:hypothetical protein
VTGCNGKWRRRGSGKKGLMGRARVLVTRERKGAMVKRNNSKGKAQSREYGKGAGPEWAS